MRARACFFASSSGSALLGDRCRHLAGVGQLGLALVQADVAVAQRLDDEHDEQAEQAQQQREEEFLAKGEFHGFAR
jgi:hypothetical protein